MLDSVPSTFRGPGGAVAVVKDGELAGQRVWGYADLDARALMTPKTIFPICSISKQMVCLVLTDLLQNDKDHTFVQALEKALHDLLPRDVASNEQLTVERLVAMQSGLRDYWALTVLWGAKPGGRFSIYQDVPQALKRLGGFHFPPGTQMSYCNTNFVTVGLAMEKATGRTLGDLLQEGLFKPAGMNTAAMRPDTERIPPPLVGYEGSEEAGYIPYQNRIEWAADAGIQASLEDMIAYEKFLDREALDLRSAYRKNSQQPYYLDGSPASYGFGLAHGDVDGIKLIGHGGGLAGFRLFRCYLAESRTSVLIMLNSEGDVDAITGHIVRGIAGKAKDQAPLEQIEVDWTGCYLDEQSLLSVGVTQKKPGKLSVSYAGRDESMSLTNSTEAASKKTQVNFESGRLKIRRHRGHDIIARPLQSRTESNDAPSYIGAYRSDGIDSTLHIAGTGRMLYGSFDGYLGQGPAHVMRYLGENVWSLICRRSLDAPAPGEWTMVFHRGSDGNAVTGVTVGCWLARGIYYEKLT